MTDRRARPKHLIVGRHAASILLLAFVAAAIGACHRTEDLGHFPDGGGGSGGSGVTSSRVPAAVQAGLTVVEASRAPVAEAVPPSSPAPGERQAADPRGQQAVGLRGRPAADQGNNRRRWRHRRGAACHLWRSARMGRDPVRRHVARRRAGRDRGPPGLVSVTRWSDGTSIPISNGLFGARSMAFSGDGKLLVASTEDALKVWRVSDGALVHAEPALARALSVAASTTAT